MQPEPNLDRESEQAVRPKDPPPLADAARLAALARTRLLDAAPDREFDRFTRLAARALAVPVSLISFLDDKFEHLYSHHGGGEATAGERAQPHNWTYCYRVVAEAEPIIIRDARSDPRTVGAPFAGGAEVSAYMGIPLAVDGQVIGSFCVIDHRPRDWSESEVETLVDLAQAVILLIASREQRLLAEATQAHLRTTLASIGDGLITTDVRGAISYLNPVAEQLTGWNIAEAVGQPLAGVFRIVHETTREPVRNPVEKVLECGGIVGLANHTTLIARDGTERAIDDSAAPIKLPDGSSVGCILVFRDITERRDQEIELDRAKIYLESVLAAGNVGTWTWELADDDIIIDEYLARMIGFPPEQSRRGPLQAYLDRIHPEDHAAIRREVSEAIDSTDRYDVEYRVIRPDGETRWLTARGRVRRDEDGKAIQLPGVVVDITEQKRLQDQLRDTKTRLDRLLSAGSVATWAWDVIADRLIADDNLALLFDVSPEEARGGNLAAYTKAIHPDDRERVGRAIAASVAAGAHYDAEYRVLDSEGRIRWLNARGVIKRDAGGRATTFDGVVIETTDRRNAEQAVREKEAFQRLIFEAVRDFSIFTTDLDGTITSWNAGAEYVFGYTEAEAVGRPAAMVFTPEDRAAGVPEKEMRAAAETGKGTDERWHLRKDGTRFFASGMVRPLSDDAGKLIGFAKVARDVTQTRELTLRLQESEERFRTLFDSIDEGFCVLQLRYDAGGRPDDYRFLMSNPAFETIVRIGNPTGRWASEVLPGLNRTWHETYARIAETRQPERFEMDEVTMEGRSFTAYAFPIGDPAEHKVAVIFNDITHRKAAEIAIQEQAGRLQQLSVISVRLTDAHDVNSVLGIVTEAARALIPAHHAAATMIPNPRYPQPTNVFSHSPERRQLIDLPNIDGLALYGTIQRANRPIRLTAAQLDADPRWQLLGKIVADDPTLNGWLAAPLVGHDGASMGLLQLSDKLVGEFTAEDEAILIQLTRIASIAVQNARLYEDLRGNDQRKDEFLAMLAHELRNPLGAISSGVQLVQTVQKPELLAELRGMIQHQVRHLTHLIDDLLDVSRITQGKVELRKRTVELSAICRKAAELAGPQVDEKRHELSVSTPDEPVMLEADPTRVEQMLSNLLTNAAKYSEPGRSIDLSAKVEGGEVVFRVRDQGYGITAEMLPKIFGLFTQVDATIDRARGGLGIGLTLVKNLAELHGGSISATSEGRDMGSEFALRLPIGEPGPSSPPGDAPSARPAAPRASDERRILIIDDNRDTARMTSRLLGHQGYEMMMAHDGHEGVEAAKAFRPHVVLLDIGLPGLNGYEVAAALRDHESCRGSLFVAVSGYGEAAARERSAAAGIDHHLTKPLDFDRLDEILRSPARSRGGYLGDGPGVRHG